MPSGYETIPSNEDGRAFSKRTGIVALIAILVVGIFLRGTPSPSPSDSLPISPEEPSTPDLPWPSRLIKFHGPQPLNTAQALKMGWKKNGDCVKSLGEPWLFRGEKSLNTSATIYYTPQVGDTPGVASGIEVDFYGYIEENLVGSFFSEERTSKDGTYHSLAVALRDSGKQDLCDTESPIAYPNEAYIAISPDLVNMIVPVQENSPELKANWKEGSCIHFMGYHWARDVVGGSDLTYKSENLVPVVPMYNSVDGFINGIFFVSSSKKQFWPEGCPVQIPPPPCAMPYLNIWDTSAGLSESNAHPPWHFCTNFCGKECKFTGSESGVYTTMHWLFRDTSTEICNPDSDKRSYCRSDDYPIMEDE